MTTSGAFRLGTTVLATRWPARVCRIELQAQVRASRRCQPGASSSGSDGLTPCARPPSMIEHVRDEVISRRPDWVASDWSTRQPLAGRVDDDGDSKRSPDHPGSGRAGSMSGPPRSNWASPASMRRWRGTWPTNGGPVRGDRAGACAGQPGRRSLPRSLRWMVTARFNRPPRKRSSRSSPRQLRVREQSADPSGDQASTRRRSRSRSAGNRPEATEVGTTPHSHPPRRHRLAATDREPPTPSGGAFPPSTS